MNTDLYMQLGILSAVVFLIIAIFLNHRKDKQRMSALLDLTNQILAKEATLETAVGQTVTFLKNQSQQIATLTQELANAGTPEEVAAVQAKLTTLSTSLDSDANTLQSAIGGGTTTTTASSSSN